MAKEKLEDFIFYRRPILALAFVAAIFLMIALSFTVASESDWCNIVRFGLFAIALLFIVLLRVKSRRKEHKEVR